MQRETWSRLQKAIEYYESREFKYVDVAWTVSKEASDLTKPEGCKDFIVNGKVLVGSAEQAFLEMYDTLDKGLYYAITPCFRDEPVINELNKQYFLKLELFSKNVLKFNYIFNSAYEFFLSQVDDIGSLTIDYISGKWNKDICYKEIELGSYYYVSKNKELQYVCGTGLAEPRLTVALRQ